MSISAPHCQCKWSAHCGGPGLADVVLGRKAVLTIPMITQLAEQGERCFVVIPHFFGPSASLAGDIIPQLQLLKQKVPAWARAGAWGLSPVRRLLSGAVQALHGVCGGSALVLGKVDFQLQPPRRDPPSSRLTPGAHRDCPEVISTQIRVLGISAWPESFTPPPPFVLLSGAAWVLAGHCMSICGALHEHMLGTA